MQSRTQHSIMLKTTSPMLFNRLCCFPGSSSFSKLNKFNTNTMKIPATTTTTTATAGAGTRNLTTTAATTTSETTTTQNNYLVTLENLKFDNTFTAELPADPRTDKTTRQVENSFFSYVDPTGTGTEPTTIAVSDEVATLIGLDPSEKDRPEFALVFSGNALLPGETRPYAQCYGGHQFGSWAGQLGDGRAICLGEVMNEATGVRWELQLKGAGRTPYSRFADGRAVLRSSLREYVASEAMAALGVPTTRALSLIGTGDDVLRDMFYNGNQREEPGAVVCRVARSFIRFGTFQLPVSRGDNQIPLATVLADYVIKHFYPECCDSSSSYSSSSSSSAAAAAEEGGENNESRNNNKNNKYARLLKAVATRTAFVVSEWMRVGFVHGVLNTDNMSIVGDTIDYGPYGFLERYDPEFTPNTTDLPRRRYSYQAQPEIGQWNILQLARSMAGAGLMTEDEAREGIAAYNSTFSEAYTSMMMKKMGLKDYDRVLINGLLKEMFEDAADYTNTFRALSSVDASADGAHLPAELAAAIGADELSPDRVAAWEDWVKLYKVALRGAGWENEEERKAVQNGVNPAVIPRNHVMVGIIGDAERGEYASLHAYLEALKTPYSEEGVEAGWRVPGPKQSRMGVELLSCSS